MDLCFICICDQALDKTSFIQKKVTREEFHQIHITNVYQHLSVSLS